MVGVSGGIDSVVLLHLFRFGLPGWDLDLVAAHFDHRLRPASASDARWVAGLCRAWAIPLVAETAADPPKGESEARAMRYAFLHRAQAAQSARWVLTAHHADDQAETVLFRAVRGAGIRGLRGILPSRDGWLLRPLLPFNREELVAYAARVGLAWREDPTNLETTIRRNVVRHSIMPALERSVAPGASKSLARLATYAQQVDDVVDGLARAVLVAATRHADPSRLVLDRGLLCDLAPEVRAAVLQAAARQLGRPLSRTGTHLAVEVSSREFDGGGRDLGGGVHGSAQYDDLVLQVSGSGVPSTPVTVPGTAPGVAGAVFGGRAVHVRWGMGVGTEPRRWFASATFDVESLRFPLSIRPWQRGDRIQLAYGTKKLKSLFQEARVPRWKRNRQPLLVDDDQRVLWAPELATSVLASGPSDTMTFGVAVEDAGGQLGGADD